jgi:hypothetical protein
MERHERKTPALVVNGCCLRSTCLMPLAGMQGRFLRQWDARIKLNIAGYLRLEHLTPWERRWED